LNLAALDSGRSTAFFSKIMDSKIIFNHGWAEKRKAMLGQAKLALCFQIPLRAMRFRRDMEVACGG